MKRQDPARFTIAAVLTLMLAIMTVGYNIVREYVAPEIEGYFMRRLYYERVISQKGLSLRKGSHWKKKE